MMSENLPLITQNGLLKRKHLLSIAMQGPSIPTFGGGMLIGTIDPRPGETECLLLLSGRLLMVDETGKEGE
jgi:hypothetical protein